jgi:WD40 repeat protein
MSSRRLAEAASPPAADAPPSVEFQRLWQTGKPPRIELFVSERPAISVSELAAIVRVDLRQRWRRGEQPGASDYLTRFPRVQTDPTLVVDLIYTEFLVREEMGERRHLPLLQVQFPQHAAELAAQVELHDALENSDLENSDLESGELDYGEPDNGAETHSPQDTLLSGAKPRTRLPSLGPGYEVLAEIGRGGMGVVYRARQVGLNRLVALKMVRSAESTSVELLARFRAEAEAVARLHHPNIVQIFDYGEHDGLPYLALELVEGQTLAARIGNQPWSDRQAAALIASLAVALQFAHERGVIHRDLKPANILLEARQGLPDEIPKITDFGLAKVFRDDSGAQTHTGSVLGTPSYMAPEQAAGQGELIGPPTDVYALGAILYELLAGQPPFRGPTAIATLQQVLHENPVGLRRLNPRAPRDLVTICEKCLSKEPTRRYASAGALASDLERFLADRPIQARRTGSLERGWRWCWRNPALALMGAVVGVLLLTVAFVSSVSSVRLAAELKQRKEAQTAEHEARKSERRHLWDAYLAEVNARTASRKLGHRFASLETVERASMLLDKIGRTPERERQLRNAAIAALALPDLRPLRELPRNKAPAANDQASALSANRYLDASESGDLVLRTLDGRELLRIEHRGINVTPAISRDGRYVGVSDSRGSKVWRIKGAAENVEAKVAWEQVGAWNLALAPDGRHAAVVGADSAMHWIDLDSGKAVRQLGRGESKSAFSFHDASRRIAVVGDKSVQIIAWDTGAILNELPLTTAFPDVAWHPAGEHLAIGGIDDGVALWHVASNRQVLTYPHFGAVKIHFVGRGDYLLTHNIWDSHLNLWHTATGQQVLSDPTFPNFSVEQTPEGRNLLFVRDSTEAALWEVDVAPACSSLPHSLHSGLGWRLSAAISERGRLLMLGGAQGLELWDLERQQLAGRLEGELTFATFIDDGSIVARTDKGIFLWPRSPAAGRHGSTTTAIVFGPPRQLFGATVDPKFAISPDGKFLVARTREGWRVAGFAAPQVTLATAPLFEPRTVAMTPDAKWVALGSWHGYGVSIFSPDSGGQVAHLATGLHAWPLFSPDMRLLATTPDGVHVWNTKDWQRVADLRARGDTASDLGIAFSPDSRVLAVSQPTGTTRLVDPTTGLDWAVLTHPDQIAGSYLCFSQDQRWLVTTSIKERRAVRCWDLRLIRRELLRLGLDWPADILRAPTSADHAPTPLEASFNLGPHWSK